MWVTIYCDASTKKRSSTGAYWIKSNKFRLVEAVRLTEKDSTQAELEIAYVAIKRVLDQYPGEITGVFVKSDNISTVRLLKFGSLPSKNKRLLHWQSLTKKMLSDNNVRIRIQHVKGHSENNDTPSWLNNQVDKLASNRKDNGKSTKT